MSAYKKIKSVVRDAELLKSVLRDLRIPFEEGESLHLYGYHGRKREETADIIVRRSHIEGAANDIGWARQEDGSYQLIVSEYDTMRTKDKTSMQYKIVCAAMQEYSRREVIRRYEAEGYEVKETRVDGKIQLEVTPGRRTRITQPERAKVRIRR